MMDVIVSANLYILSARESITQQCVNTLSTQFIITNKPDHVLEFLSDSKIKLDVSYEIRTHMCSIIEQRLCTSMIRTQ